MIDVEAIARQVLNEQPATDYEVREGVRIGVIVGMREAATIVDQTLGARSHISRKIESAAAKYEEQTP